MNMKIIDERKKPERVRFDRLKPLDVFEWQGHMYMKIYTLPSGENAVNLSSGSCYKLYGQSTMVTPLETQLVIKKNMEL